LAQAPARVVLIGSLTGRYTGGVKEFEIEAKNLRGIIKALDELYPGLGEHLEKETTVAIDGEIYQDALLQPIAGDSEVFLFPKIAGG